MNPAILPPFGLFFALKAFSCVMHVVQQVLFIMVLAAAIWWFARSVGKIRRNINLGKEEKLNDHPELRWKNMVLLALGQKKMFKRPVPAILHFFVYAGFVIINIEILEIILDGILGTHRLFAPALGDTYSIFLSVFESLAFLVLVGCILFLIRRNILKLYRLNQKELDGWPKSDANYILLTEVILMVFLFMMNATDQVLQDRGISPYTATGDFLISSQFTFLFENVSTDTLIVLERLFWWLHIVGILAFLNYLPISKHLHIVLAFPNAYYGKIVPQGQMKNMPDIQKEVLLMMEPAAVANEPTPEGTNAPPRFGAKDVFDLSWKSLLDAYSCTECGRCTSVCPANITGKKLSPRKIMMDTRDRVEEVGKVIDKNKVWVDDGKSLVHDYITVEELRACTTCNACVEACPVSIDPLRIITEARRYLVMEESNAPQEWNQVFGNMENNMAPWKMSPDDRDAWVTH